MLVDVGCGDGRVINFWLNSGYKNPIVGIEIDGATARSTSDRMARYSNVEIIHGDASKANLEGTVFYLFNPFIGQMMVNFERRRRGCPGKIII
jgi:16S rRNA A1518/A1519 N6-dimethyltransferase RsmA/KsgA/DIM1 with predicted DNA glycosylase/AP lyase activity